MKYKEKEIEYMQRALSLALLGGGNVAPNPKVGCVIVHNDQIIGEGYHERFGEAHAEVNAIASVKNQSFLKEAEMYVTLEPCSHFGKTPPCSDLIVEKKLKKVYIACIDTFSKVSGKGIERLKKNGIEVDLGLMESEAKELNKSFFTFHEKKRPYIILKWAETLDGFIDRLPEKRNEGINWITGENSKKMVHKLRSETPGILVGCNTVINDNPQLNVRKVKGKDPYRFVIDPNNKIDSKAKLLNDNGKTMVFNKSKNELDLSAASFVQLENFNLKAILNEIYKLSINAVLIEGGATTINNFIAENLWDEAYVFQGNKKFNEGLKAPQLKNAKIISTQNLDDKDKLTIYKNQCSI